ncbi:MAG: HIT family protein [Actinomycetota bacterium]|jgi:histidine triad (HIT) family protein
MATIFTRIIDGDEPARFVWRDERCVGFLAATPVQPGHTLVVPIDEIGDWLRLDEATSAHLMMVAQRLGRAMEMAFAPKRVGLMIAGFDVPHVHLHVVPLETPYDFDYDRQVMDPNPLDLDTAQARILGALESFKGEGGRT